MARVRALVDGHWQPELHPGDPLLEHLRQRPTRYRDWVTAEGSPGPVGQKARRAEPGRYHLYVSYACPWAHRAILYHRLNGLEDVVSMSVLHPRMAGCDSWQFGESLYSTHDHLYGARHLHDIYARGDPQATTIVTVPMLWDRATETIVNRESSDIIRILERAFTPWARSARSFRPAGRAEAIEQMNRYVLQRVCTAVYRVGFAGSQKDYDREVARLFDALNELEERLSWQSYLLGDTITEADWHLFCTLVRFDAAYHGALHCTRWRLVDYPALTDYTRRLYAYPGIAETVDFDAIRLHYFDDHPEIDHTIVPAVPAAEFRNHDTTAEGRGTGRLTATSDALRSRRQNA